MANVTITGLPAAAALTGVEVVPIDQSGSTVKTTVQDIANLATGTTGTSGTSGTSGSGGASTLDVVTVGTLGSSPVSVLYSSVAYLSPESGTQSAPVTPYPTINISGGMGSTATLSSISFPTLTVGSISIQQFSTLTSVSFPALTAIVAGMMGGGLAIGNNSALTTVDISSLVIVPPSPYFGWFGCAFSEATVDHVLVRMVATGATNGNLQLNSGTSAAPSATGLAAKDTLEGRGWTVAVNLPLQTSLFRASDDIGTVCAQPANVTLYWNSTTSLIPNQTQVFIDAQLIQPYVATSYVADSATNEVYNMSNGYAFTTTQVCL